MPSLVVRDLHFAYPDGSFHVGVKGLEVEAGGRFAILGPSGGGKTTLLRLLSGLLKPKSGSVQVDGTDLVALSEARRRDFRLRHMGLVFQDFALLDYLTVEENLLLPTQFCRGKGNSEVRDHAYALTERLQVDQHWRRLAGQLSQGEKQRVAVARALVHRPNYVFADEPTASLDGNRRELVLDLLLGYVRERQAALVMVTHDREVIRHFPEHLHLGDLEGA